MHHVTKRVLQSVFILFAVVTLTFVIYRLLPGGPIKSMRINMIQEATAEGRQVDMERINRLVRLYTRIDPDKPMHIAYFEYMRDVILYQDFGQSIYNNEPVAKTLFKGLPWSIFVSVYGLFLGFFSNIFLGMAMAYKRGSWFDSSSSMLAIILTSVPYYVVAIVALAFLAFEYGLFPTGGRFDPSTTPGFNIEFMTSVVHHGMLPIMTGFVVGFGGRALGMRGNCIRLMGEDFIRAARIRGLNPSRITVNYIGRNAVLPMYTGLMISISSLFSSSIIMERIFTYPGVGWYTFDALQNRDYPLLMGVFILLTTATLVGITVADLTYQLIDPRADTTGESY